MNHYKRLYSVYRTIKRSRFQKKWQTYKTMYSMSIDKTILIYVFIAIAYGLTALIMSGSFHQDVGPFFAFIEERGRENIALIASLYPLRYIFQSFRRPGIVFSSTEYQLSMLPYSLRSIWNVVVFGKWLKLIGVGLIIWLVLVFTPLSIGFVSMYIFLFVMVDLLMTAPIWRLYQQRFLMKLILFLGVSVSIGALLAVRPTIAIVTVYTMIIIWNIYAWRNLMQHVQWGKVTATSDFHIWNIPFVSQFTKVPFKREKRIYVLQQLPYRRKRLSYTPTAIHRRLWHSYIIKNTRTIFQLIGSLLVLLTVLAFIREFTFYIGIAATIYMFTSMSASLFYDRFQSDVLQTLPWNIPLFKRTFMRWNVYGGLIVVIPIITYYMFHFTWWAPLQMLLVISVFMYMLHVQMDRSAVLLAKETKQFTIPDTLGFIGLIAIVGSATYPVVSLVSFGYLVAYFRSKRTDA